MIILGKASRKDTPLFTQKTKADGYFLTTR